jgi:integrase
MLSVWSSVLQIERQEENKMVAGHLTLKNGKYYAVLNYKNAGGQRKTKWISLGLSEKGNKRKAEVELARLRAEFEPPKEVGDLSSDMLFADYLLEWLEIAKGRLAVATYSSYAAMIKKPVGPYFRQRNLTLRELEARHLQMFYSEMLRKVKPNTVIHYHAIIHSALKYAVKTDMLVQNVADKVDRPKKNSFQPVFLSAEEMQKMFKALRGTKLELPVLVAAFYGLRRGEVLGLKWDAIDFERGTISVIRTVTTITLDGKQTEIEQQSAKTKSSLRTLPLIGSFREYFLQVKEAQELNKQVCGNCYNHEYDGFVFVDELGERMRANYLTSAFPKFLEDHGLRRMRFHDLRHSCASLLLANGVPLKHIQEWLGHSDFTTTANIYAHLDYKSKITSAQAMETGLALPEGGDFESRWGSIDVGENG